MAQFGYVSTNETANEVYGLYVRVTHSGATQAIHDLDAIDDYRIAAGAASPQIKVYETDLLEVYAGPWDAKTGDLLDISEGWSVDGWIEISGFDAGDVGLSLSAEDSFTFAAYEDGVWHADIMSDSIANELTGVALYTGEATTFFDASGTLFLGNGVGPETQTIGIEAYIDPTDVDLRPGDEVRASATITYLDLDDDKAAAALENSGGTGGTDGGTGGGTGDFNEIEGTRKNDKLKGTGGDDWIFGYGGKDKLIGKGGDDLLSGGGGKDKLKGKGGDDLLEGDGGKDKLIGAAGMDSLEGGKGKDALKGGAGSDFFVFDGKSGNDKILDWGAKGDADTIMIGSGASDFGDLSIRNADKGAQVEWDHGSVLLVGVDAKALSDLDFLFF